MSKKPKSRTRAAVHVVPSGDLWAVRREGATRASSLHPTQAQAERQGRRTAKREHVEFEIHDERGRVRTRASYWNDPRGRG